MPKSITALKGITNSFFAKALVASCGWMNNCSVPQR